MLGLFTSNTTSDNSLTPFLMNLMNLALPPLNYRINPPLEEVWGGLLEPPLVVYRPPFQVR